MLRLLYLLVWVALDGFGTPAGAAAQDASAALLAWSRLPEAQRNRVLDTRLAPEVQTALLEVLSRGVSGCDCFTRRVRWAWALPVPSDPGHPALVVSFSDPPRDQSHVAYYARFAFLRFLDGRYAVSSALLLKRPAMSESRASLTVRIRPRRDLDEDGQLDVAITFRERWPDASFCGSASFGSATPQLTLREEPCSDEAVSEGVERADPG